MVFPDYTHPDDAGLDWQLYEELVAGKRDKYEIEKRFVRKDGRIVWGRLVVSIVKNRDEKRSQYVVAMVEEVTDRKHAERGLLESEQRMRLAQEVAQIGTFDHNLVTGESRWSSELEAMYAIPPGAFPKKIDAFLKVVHPDDLARVVDLRARSMESGAGQGEWRVIWPDRSVHWISTRWKVFQYPSGKPERLIGAAYDVTDRKRIEEELRLAKEKLAEEKHYLEESIDTERGFGEIVGRSALLKEAMDKIARVATSDATVLLLGETGTGKELAVRALHRMSQRHLKSFIKVNCAAIPSGLLESELFGHEKGAFTGAVSRKVGRLELADGGTLFLDEIGDIPLSLQPKLLRVLQEMEFERLGSNRTLKVSFRLVAATNHDLLQKVKAGQFRIDLYYRLHVFPIILPPLRERREDIPSLIEHFVRKVSQKMGKSIISIPTKTMEELVRWDWPGNIRELENFVERSVILTQGSVLRAPLSELVTADLTSDLRRDVQRDRILLVVRECHGRLGGPQGAAARLGLKRTTLQSKLEQMGIKPAVYRNTPSA
jgi:DNA-binding NtrC family response regulator